MIQVKQDNLIFALNEQEKTAWVIGNDKAVGDVLIPRSIYHENQEFIITSIKENSFQGALEIKNIQFPQDSEVQVLGQLSFSFSSIESISIPSSVTKICEGAFTLCYKLQNIEIPPNSTLISRLTIPPTFCVFQKEWCCGIAFRNSKYTSKQ